MSEYKDLFEQLNKMDDKTVFYTAFHSLNTAINIAVWGYDKGINYLTGDYPLATIAAFYGNHNCDCYLTLEHDNTEQWRFKIVHESGTYEALGGVPRDAIYKVVLQWHQETGLLLAHYPPDKDCE